MGLPRTLSELQASGYQDKTVKGELKANLIEKIRKQETLFPGIVGYSNTVIPQIENAILSGHDIVLLGERGQAKSRLMRSLVRFLDELIPVVSGCEINDNPFNPVCRQCKDKISTMQGDTPIEWLSREKRYTEKLATPDVTIADLIGDIDPVKVAEGRYLSDERSVHYGMVPRTNRGIFSINELPDLHEKIQVGLFNVLEERDVQIRGYTITLPLDIFIIVTANPEDYTSRGRIITPLKDRFGAQIRTHYPRTADEEIKIVDNEKAPFHHEGFTLLIPHFMKAIIAEISHFARQSPAINQYSGVSVRMTIHNMENVVSNAFRRSLCIHEQQVVPRIIDLGYLCSSMKGKIEWDFIDDSLENSRLQNLIRDAIAKVFQKQYTSSSYSAFLNELRQKGPWEITEMTPSEAFVANLALYPSLKKMVSNLTENENPAEVASSLEFILEGLASIGKIKKQIREDHIQYTATS